MFSGHQSHSCGTAQIGHPHIPHCKTDRNVTALGTVMPTPTNLGLNPDDKS